MDNGLTWLAGEAVADWTIIDDARVIITNIPMGLPSLEVGSHYRVIIDDEHLDLVLAVIVEPVPNSDVQIPFIIWKVLDG